MKTEWIIVVALAPAVVLAGLTPSRAGARTLDRRSAVRTAMQQNPQVAAARAQEAAMQAQRRQADAARWPTVTANAAVGPSLKATLVPGTSVTSVEEQYHNFHFSDLSAVFVGTLTVIQPLYTFGKIALRQEAASHGLRAREAQTRMERSDVALEVARIYETYLLARDGRRFFDEMAHWLERTLEETQERLARHQGKVTDRDILRIQTGQGLIAIEQHLAEAGLAQTSAGLIAYLGLPRNEPIEVAEDELGLVGDADIPPSVDTLVALASHNRAELVALSEGQSALDALARAEAAGMKPDIFALGLLAGAYTPGRDWIETRFVVDPLNNFVPWIAVGLRWQVQGYMASERAKEQHAQADVMSHLGQWAEAGIPAEVRRAYEDVLRTRKDVESGELAAQKAKQWMVESSADYAIGFLDVRELSDAAEAYVAIRTAVLKAHFEHNVAMAELSKATGTFDGGRDMFYLAAPSGDHPGGANAEARPTVRVAMADLTKARRTFDGGRNTFYLAAAPGDRPGGDDAAAEATVRKSVDEAFAILKDPARAGSAHRAQRIAALRAVADHTFDWSAMARSSLGAQWRSLNPAQRTRFVDVFKDVLAAEYMDDIDRFQGSEVVTVDGSSREGDDVVVRTTLVTASREHVPLDYRMQQESGQWKVIDLSVEKVSLVNHFRKTFSNALGNMTADQLIDRLKQQLPQRP
jgi:outer membrane protein